LCQRKKPRERLFSTKLIQLSISAASEDSLLRPLIALGCRTGSGGGTLLEPRLNFLKRHGLLVRPIDADHFIVALSQLPSLFKGFLLTRQFARQHFVLQFVIDIADKPTHLRTPFFSISSGVADCNS
jgi:hypothetical protein